jgi:hypothetical protein
MHYFLGTQHPHGGCSRGLGHLFRIIPSFQPLSQLFSRGHNTPVHGGTPPILPGLAEIPTSSLRCYRSLNPDYSKNISAQQTPIEKVPRLEYVAPLAALKHHHPGEISSRCLRQNVLAWRWWKVRAFFLGAGDFCRDHVTG